MQLDTDNLNSEQRKAIEVPGGPILILAGAGSGKTRVITHRIAHLILKQQIDEDRILALTFTNKAAKEMKERTADLLHQGTQPTWISTFHSFCVRVLRRDIHRLGFTRDFIIYDSSDSLSLIKECIKELHIPEDNISPKNVVYRISNFKNNLISPYQIDICEQAEDELIRRIYALYQKKLHLNNSLDFDDLIFMTVMLLKNHSDVLEYYQTKFLHILVDEYQDTNQAQYLLLQLISSKNNNLCVVGDDDQSIYKWRGATIKNILDFEKGYPNATTIRLEENYRSTQNILDAAWEVVRKVTARREKKLWTKKKAGEKIHIYRALNEIDEADYISRTIKSLYSKNSDSYKDAAIFYRTNAQSRVIEDSLQKNNISYQIFGGLKFYDRKEIKDILAYLRVAVNPSDSVSLKRVINTPARGIGKATILKIEEKSKQNEEPLFESARSFSSYAVKNIDTRNCVAQGIISLADSYTYMNLPSTKKTKQSTGLDSFIAIIDQLKKIVASKTASEVIEEALTITGYERSLEIENTTESKSRLENLKELITAANEYEEKSIDKGIGGFLERTSLTYSSDEISESSGVVSLMTLHLSKGLEFKHVFMSGMEEYLFPHSRSMECKEELEEERRLCYVGMTRAKERLFMTHAIRRRIYGREQSNRPSQFLTDIPVELTDQMEKFRPGNNDFLRKYQPSVKQPISSGHSEDDKGSFKAGNKIVHNEFGEGLVLHSEGSGKQQKLSVYFKGGVGKKKVLALFVKKLHVN
jgi:DNA helicase-2/ATP-dependent DNA helicase PcrA